MRIFDVAARLGLIVATVFRGVVTLVAVSCLARCRGRRAGLHDIGEQLARTFETLGGGFLKIGQVLSTRIDILPSEVTAPLERLQDSLSPLPGAEVVAIIERSLGRSAQMVFCSFDLLPIGSASIAQVHRAVLRSSGVEVAVKVRRPRIESVMNLDSRLFSAVVRLISYVPPFSGLPLNEAFREVTTAIQEQTSFRTEAGRHRQFYALFPSGVPVRVPHLIDEYCTNEVLVMEYFPHLAKITSCGLTREQHRNALTVGLRALYRMLFSAGLVHCDLHPGNILVDSEGRVVILDFGFSAVMQPSERLAFAELFLSIALNDGGTASRIVVSTAARIPPDLDTTAFEQDISDLVARSSGVMANEFSVCSFVAALFSIQRKHGVYGSKDFTLAILSLAVYEGIIQQCCSDLDFQREAVPIVLAALQGYSLAPRDAYLQAPLSAENYRY